MDKLNGSGGADGLRKLLEIVKEGHETVLAALEKAAASVRERQALLKAEIAASIAEPVAVVMKAKLARVAEEFEPRLAKVERESGIARPAVDPAALRARVDKHLDVLRADLQKIAKRLQEPPPARTFSSRDLTLIHTAALQLAADPRVGRDAFSLAGMVKAELAGELQKGAAPTEESVRRAIAAVRRKVAAGEA